MSNRTMNLNDALYAYLIDTGVREPAILARLREETSELSHSAMQVAPEQGQFMQMLVRLMGVKRIVEVGTFTGYSSLSMALALPEGGELIACDASEEWTAMARRYWQEAGVAEKVTLHLGPAAETLLKLIDDYGEESFDLAFIDADKINYDTYYEHCLKLVRPGGAILVDNVLWGGSVIDPENRKADTHAIRTFNEKLMRDARIDMVMLPIADGLTLAVRRPLV